MRLGGKTVAITGAARGIGRACAERYAADGASVVVADIDAAGVDTVVSAVRSAGGTATGAVVDVSTDDGNSQLVAAADGLGGLDVLHANAAVQIMGQIDTFGADDWDRVHQVNLRGIYLGIKHAIPALRARGGGAITITSSILALTGDPDLPAYGASKGGLTALAKAVAAAHGVDRIRCNTICPGDVETPLLQEFFDFQPDPAGAREEITSRYPLGRLAQPSDIAAAASFLASDDASYITGIDLLIDGGLRARIY
jgi:NAD(P)-dependent dehydrogenase (short-subunit alcohol dehydrogenase family)